MSVRDSFFEKHGISRTAGSRVEKCLAKTKHVEKLFQWVVSTYPMIKVKAGQNIVFPKTCKNTTGATGKPLELVKKTHLHFLFWPVLNLGKRRSCLQQRL